MHYLILLCETVLDKTETAVTVSKMEKMEKLQDLTKTRKAWSSGHRLNRSQTLLRQKHCQGNGCEH